MIDKQTRQKVYEKYNGRCAYCGRKIEYKDMQVDHFIAKRGWSEQGGDDFSNLMPSCRMCNHYKRANPLELFRRYIQQIPKKLQQNYIYKVGIAYGNIIENEKEIKFYFEENKNEAEKALKARGKMKAWTVTNKDYTYVLVVFAESRGKAKVIALEYDAGFPYEDFIDLYAHRCAKADKAYNGRDVMDWEDEKDRIFMVKELGFSCSPECFDYIDCEQCTAKQFCGLYHDKEAEMLEDE